LAFGCTAKWAHNEKVIMISPRDIFKDTWSRFFIQITLNVMNILALYDTASKTQELTSQL